MRAQSHGRYRRALGDWCRLSYLNAVRKTLKDIIPPQASHTSNAERHIRPNSDVRLLALGCSRLQV